LALAPAGGNLPAAAAAVRNPTWGHENFLMCFFRSDGRADEKFKILAAEIKVAGPALSPQH
jgi:hypothetical protein